MVIFLMIAELPAFASTHTLLAEYLAQYQSSPTSPGGYETLPAPEGVE